jgi:antitoxin component YwqK of YwqJK toxin-antitoxin module
MSSYKAIIESVLEQFPAMDVPNIAKLIQDMMYWKVVEEYYDTGHLKSIRCFTTKEESYYQAWYENGNRSLRCTSKEHVPYGLYQTWYEDGTCELECTFDNDNKLHGPYKRWYENGVLAIEAEFYDSAAISYIEYNQNGVHIN